MEATRTFATTAGTAGDPDTVTFQLAEPDGTETDFTIADGEVSNPAVGTWRFTYVPQASGRYTIGCIGVSVPVSGFDGASETEFVVLESEFTDPL